MKKRTLIIAEAGVNHNGDMLLAKQLIKVAAEAGADLVKFQTFSADRMVTKDASKANYQIQTSGNHESQYEMLKRLELSEDAHAVLMNSCEDHGVGFFSTGFDIESIDLLVKIGQKRFKIPSGEITNLPYLRHIGQLGHPIILSTGMSTFEEIDSAIFELEKAGTPKKLITVLHCSSEYPATIATVNLRCMLNIKKSFDVEIGYSDHTLGTEVAIAAVAIGANIIEKHITLDRNLPGPDHKASLEPNEFKEMVKAIRNIEVALGDGVKRLSSNEIHNKQVARKSLVALRDIKKGEIYSAKNVTAKRPGNGLSPMLWDKVIGSYAPRDFIQDEIIEL